MESSALGNAKVVKVLLKYKAQVKAANGEGKQALAYASRKKHVVIATTLLQHGASVNHQDPMA